MTQKNFRWKELNLHIFIIFDLLGGLSLDLTLQISDLLLLLPHLEIQILYFLLI